MKRSQPVRKTPLTSQGSPLTRRAPLAVRAPLTTAKDVLRGTVKARPPRNTGPTPAVRRLVAERAGGCCERCGQPITGEYSIHHRKPRGMGGTKDTAINSAANLLLLCGSATTAGGCHTAVEKFRQSAMTTGLIVARTADPAKVPVKRHNGWAYLGHDGTLTPTTRPETPDE